MDLIVHDTHDATLQQNYEKDIVYAMRFLQDRKYCCGCFGCWVKTPGSCVIHDDLQKAAVANGSVTRFFILTKVTFGGYSSLIKNYLDRSLGYIMPYFTKREGEMHHVMRYDTPFTYNVIGYGAKNKEQQAIFNRLVAANAVNFNAKCSVYFAEDEVAAMQMLRHLKEEQAI